jgi:hypothetical protein
MQPTGDQYPNNTGAGWPAPGSGAQPAVPTPGAYPQPYPTSGYPGAAPVYPSTGSTPAVPDPTGYPSQPYGQPAYGQQPSAQQPYGQQPYGAPGYGAYAPQGYPAQYGAPMGSIYPNPYRNGLGTAGMVCGIIGLVFCWYPFVGLVLSILAVCFGAAGVGRANKGLANNKGAATAGLVMGCIGVALEIIFWVFVLSAVGAFL